MRPKIPCKDCQERTITCHGFCEKYKAFKVANDERLKQKEKELESHYTSKAAQKRLWRNMMRKPLRRASHE